MKIKAGPDGTLRTRTLTKIKSSVTEGGNINQTQICRRKTEKKQMRSELFLHFFCSLTPNTLLLIHLQLTAGIWESDYDAVGLISMLLRS